MKQSQAALVLILCGIASPALAQDAGAWQVKVGAHVVSPDSDNGTLAGGTLKTKVGDDAKPTITLEYFFTRNWGVEALAALPFEHEVKLNGVKAADVKHLPPTFSVQYHFAPDGEVSPFVGVGLNYTRFFGIKEKGPLAGTQLDLDDSWGIAAHFGIDWRVSGNWSLTLDGRWISIETTAHVNGADVGKVKINPWVWGAAVGYRF